jgi:inosine-uridine nucleoside N-ribohydrolase
MPKRILIIADPGIDTAFAIALALFDPELEVLGLIASAGNIGPEQATQNVHVLITQLDPPRWPRLGAALPVAYDIDGTRLHGPNGLGGASFPSVSLHQPMAGDKVIVELVRQYPHEITVVGVGPLTVLARAFDRDPDLPPLIDRLVLLGGAWHEVGNASAVAEMHFFCDPLAARQVLHAGIPTTLVPLDVTRKVVFSPSDLLELPAPEGRVSQFLRQIVPFGIRASSNLYGIEGFHLKDVIGVTTVSLPRSLTTQSLHVDVEVRGELTRGMSVVDARATPAGPANVELGVGLDVTAVRDYIGRTLRRTA